MPSTSGGAVQSARIESDEVSNNEFQELLQLLISKYFSIHFSYLQSEQLFSSGDSDSETVSVNQLQAVDDYFKDDKHRRKYEVSTINICEHERGYFEFTSLYGDKYTTRYLLDTDDFARGEDIRSTCKQSLVSISFEFETSVVRDRVYATFCVDSRAEDEGHYLLHRSKVGMYSDTINSESVERIIMYKWYSELWLCANDIARGVREGSYRSRIVHDVYFLQDEKLDDILGEIHHVSKKRNFVIAFFHGCEEFIESTSVRHGRDTGFGECVKYVDAKTKDVDVT